jgi:hypothetical protein
MFVRFVTAELDEDSHKRLGIFQAVYRLKENGVLTPQEETYLQEIHRWFDKNLDQPDRFTSAKPPYYRKRQDGISWFKDSAREHINKIRELITLLAGHGVLAEMIKSDRPGYILYEDQFQIVAVPFSDSKI